MKFYGDANLNQNELQNAVLSTLTAFPSDPKQGQIAFVNSTVYICLSAGNLPVWVPLSREITAHSHIQTTAALVWNITHNLNTTSVNIQIFNESNQVIIPDDIQTTGPTTAQVTFSAVQAGRAITITGHFDGLQKSTYAYTHFQSSSSTSWVITHNLGYNPITRIFIGNNEVQPLTVTHNSTNQVTITFSTAQVGYARLV